MMQLDVSMPRDLALRRRFDGYAAICAVGFPADPGVFHLDATDKVERHLYKLQPGRWDPLHFVHVAWLPGPEAAQTVLRGAEAILDAQGFGLSNHWYRTNEFQLKAALSREAGKLNVRMWSHAELVDRLRRQADEEADRFAGGGII